jgi:geranylgeranyl reductase family protein
VIKITEDIVIVGGGPSGAYLGYLLAKTGKKPIIFDHSHPREKPCGGGISSFAIGKFPLLNEISLPKAPDNKIELISSEGMSIMTKGQNVSWALSRLHFDKFLIDKAIEYGARLIPERVIDITKKNEIWEMRTDKGKYKTKIIVGADGVNSIVRKKIQGPISKDNIGICYGCYAKSNKKESTRIMFLKDKRGYAWCFPRHDHLSIGVGITDSSNSEGIKSILDEFVSTNYPDIKILSKWGGKVPSIKETTFYDMPCSGDNWILIGDAAGHVDSVTGEGITYALWSAELAAEAIIKNNPKLFDKLWREDYGERLISSCKSRDLFYNSFLMDNSIKLANRSKTLSNFLYDTLNNQLPGLVFYKRLIMVSPKIFYEYVRSKI